MASSNSLYTASYTMSMADYGKLLTGYFALPAGVTIQSATPTGGGTTVAVIFQGTALGSWAAPTSAPAKVTLQNISGQLTLLIQSSTYSGSSGSSGM